MRKHVLASAFVALAMLALTLPTRPTQAQGNSCVIRPEAVIVTKDENGATNVRVIGESNGCTAGQVASAAFLAAMTHVQRQLNEMRAATFLTSSQMIGAEHAQFEALKNCVLGKKIGDGCPSPLGAQAFVPPALNNEPVIAKASATK